MSKRYSPVQKRVNRQKPCSSFSFYCEKNTLLHRLDTRLKLCVLLVFSIAIFLLQSWLGMLIFSALMFYAVILAQMPCSLILRSMKPLTILLVMLLVSRAFSFHAPLSLVYFLSLVGITLQASWADFGVSISGFLFSLFFLMRMVNLVTASLLLCYTSSHSQLIEAIQSMLYVLRPLKLPLDDIVNLLVMTLRFIPTCFMEFDRVLMAQKARGATFDSGSLFSKMRAWKSVFIPLMLKIFKRSEDMARTMESRCYTGEGRTVLSVHKLKCLELVLCCLICVAFLLIGWYA